jgi:proteasome alpha subunit
MAAIELASTEGFTRSAADVSLRRLAFYSLSPVLKTAFEQVYGAPYLARMIFAESGRDASRRFVFAGGIRRLNRANGPVTDAQPPRFSAVSGTIAWD